MDRCLPSNRIVCTEDAHAVSAFYLHASTQLHSLGTDIAARRQNLVASFKPFER